MEQINVKSSLTKSIITVIMACSAIALPHSVFASTVYIETNHSEYFVGDTIQFRVRVDSEGQKINAIEGEILVKHSAGTAALIDLNTAGSPFSLWPNTPLPSEDNSSIAFVGGSPGGFISDDALVLNIALQLKESGQIALVPHNVKVYLHDGQGTMDRVHANALFVNVSPAQSSTPSVDDWKTILSSDKTAPAPFDVILGRDPSILNNEHFISFFTTDSESGIAYYEVQEGTSDFLRAESPHVLADQSLQSDIFVRAVDKAGNERVVQFTPNTQPALMLLLWIIAIITIASTILLILWKILRRAK